MADRSSRAACQPEPHPAADRAADRGPAGQQAAGPGPGSAPGWACPPPRCTRCWPATAARRWPTPAVAAAGASASYERARPGELVHVDVKELGNIPGGGGWRVTGVAQGLKNKRATTSLRYGTTSHPVIGYSYLHTAIDDHSRLACTEILADERKETAAAFLARAHAWYAAAGITVERVISDNGACYRSTPWAATCAQPGITHKRTRPDRPLQRQGRALPPHPGRRMGLRPPLQLRNRTPPGA
jgi:hypothetical protein